MAIEKNKGKRIRGIPKDSDKLIVQKSNPLYSLWRSGLTLSEFKILDIYLSRIDSHHPDRRNVVFEKGELEKLLGVTKISREDLDNRLSHLLGSVVTVADPRYKRGLHKVTLFEESIAYQDENGIWTVSLACTSKAMEYFFNIEKIGYMRYKLRSITVLTSRYSYLLFLYIEKNRYRKEWTISLDELKILLGCDKDPLYDQYKYFNQRILKKCHDEISKKTKCVYEFTPERNGRKVTAIKFRVRTLADKYDEDDEMYTQYSIADWQASKEDAENLEENSQHSDDLKLFKDACKEDFSDVEMEEIWAALLAVPEKKLPDVGIDNIDLRRYHYLQQMDLRLLRYDSEKKIKNHAAYLIKMIKGDSK